VAEAQVLHVDMFLVLHHLVWNFLDTVTKAILPFGRPKAARRARGRMSRVKEEGK